MRGALIQRCSRPQKSSKPFQLEITNGARQRAPFFLPTTLIAKVPYGLDFISVRFLGVLECGE